MFNRRTRPLASRHATLKAVSAAAAFAVVLALAAIAQQPAPEAPQPDTSPAPQSDSSATPHAAKGKQAKAKPDEAEDEKELPGSITEEELKQMLVGKTFYLRGGYLDDTLSFNERGTLIGHSPQGSYTLSMVEIDHVRLTKHKVELEGVRYGMHFLGALPYEDPANAVDKVRITPKKKILRITIDRELVVRPKKAKEPKLKKNAAAKPPASPANPAPAAAPPAPVAAASSQPPANPAPADASPAQAAVPETPGAAPESQTATSETTAAPPETTTSASTPEAGQAPEPTDVAEAKAEMAAAPEAERPADPASITTTLSPAHATQVLKDAIDKVFATGLDDQLKASLPDFWKLYYQAAASKTDYRPSDPAVLRQNAVDKKARLLTTFEPQSNQFAQDNGVAGMALYHAVIGPDGKPGEIAVARPIGFGLDENAVEAIRNAKFEPAMKNGQPVPVLLDLVVEFRIYSNRTKAAAAATPDSADKPAEPTLPGPYSVHAPH